MRALLHISDTHFGTEVPAVVAALERMVQDLRPEILLLSGDITQRATRPQFRSARAFLDRLGVPRTLVMPGNHDIPLFNVFSRLLTPYRRYREELGCAVAGVDDLPGLRIIRVKSTRRLRHIDGELSAAQIEAVAGLLRDALNDVLRIVVTHQPLWVDRPRDQKNRCHGAQHALAAWREAGADLLLAGHIHWPFAERLEGSRPMWAINAGTALSSRVRDGIPQSCNLLRFDPARPRQAATLERWDFASADGTFQRVAHQALTID